MTLLKKEFDVLVETQKYLREEGGRPDLASALLDIINRANRERELAWSRSHRPPEVEFLPESVKRRLEKNDPPLMQRLLDAGYPREEMDHHESDLYVYVTPVTAQVVERWCKEHGYDRTWHCPTFFDQITGRLMYDCAFQYISEEAIR